MELPLAIHEPANYLHSNMKEAREIVSKDVLALPDVGGLQPAFLVDRCSSGFESA
jgi:hypothetical protein